MIQDNRTLAELENAYLSDASAAEFDRIVRKSESRGRRPIVWGTMLAAAASLALILTLNLSDSKCGFDGLLRGSIGYWKRPMEKALLRVSDRAGMTGFPRSF